MTISTIIGRDRTITTLNITFNTIFLIFIIACRTFLNTNILNHIKKLIIKIKKT
jgi:hypothetical protein